MIPSLNGLRGFAALMVIICHLPIPPLLHQHYPFITSIFAAGWLGVPIYFSLSGYLITWLALEEKKTFKDLSLRFFL